MKNTIVELFIRIICAFILVVLFMANPVLCALSFALGWPIFYGIVFSIVTLFEIWCLVFLLVAVVDK